MSTQSVFDAFSDLMALLCETTNNGKVDDFLFAVSPNSYSIESTLRWKKVVLERIDKEIKDLIAKADDCIAEIESRQKIVDELKSKIKVELPTLASLEVEAQAASKDPVKQLALVKKYIDKHLNLYYGASGEVKIHEKAINELEQKKKMYMNRISELSRIRMEYVPVNEDTVKTTTIDPKNMPKYDTCAGCGKCGGKKVSGVPDSI